VLLCLSVDVCALQAKLLRDIDSVVAVVIALKTHYPKVDIANIIKRKPKLLLSSQQRVEEDALKVGGAVLCSMVPYSKGFRFWVEP
jgi:hypothetical protein